MTYRNINGGIVKITILFILRNSKVCYNKFMLKATSKSNNASIYIYIGS